MDETTLIWMDGALVPWKDADIHVLTHGLHYGGAVFEGIRVYETRSGPAIFRLEDHIARFFRSADALGMTMRYTIDDIVHATALTVKENGLSEGYIRPIAYYGYGKMGLNPTGAKTDIAIAAWPWGSYLGADPVRVKIPGIRKTDPRTTWPEAKISGNYQNSILASLEVRSAGYDEALLLDCEGNVAEGPGENFFMAKDGKLLTPARGNILPGITRDSVLAIAKEMGVDAQEKMLRSDDALGADEAFFTGTAAEVTPIASIDDTPLKQAYGELTKRIRAAYSAIVHDQGGDHRDWLTFV